MDRFLSAVGAHPRAIVASFTVGLALVAAAAVFAASGGQSPSGGPNMSLGSHAFSSCLGVDREFWGLVGLSNGDQVTININDSDGESFYILAPSTTDYNWRDQNELDTAFTSGTNKEAMTFTASEGSGRYVLYVNCYSEDAYDFVVASVLHVVRIDIVPRPRSIARQGTFTVRAINGDGAGITDPSLSMSLYGGWGGVAHKFGVATPSGGKVTFHYALPAKLRGRTITLWVGTKGNSRYLNVTTDKISVAVR